MITTHTIATPAGDEAALGDETTRPRSLILFDTGPSLDRIPDDVLDEILSYLPTLNDRQVLFGHRVIPPVIPSSQLVRTPTLRALSQTSRLLRLRCLAMAWQNVELCGVNIPQHSVTFPKAIGRATRAAVRVLRTCPHLLPLIQTVSVVLTHYHPHEIIPAFAACLTKLPNLTTIQGMVIAPLEMNYFNMSIIEDSFEGEEFPSVRKISLPGSAHGIIKCCPNVEEVICTEGNGSTVVGSLVKGNCRQVRILKGIDAPLTRLVKQLPHLKYIDVPMGVDFPLLETIEILTRFLLESDELPTEAAAPDIKEASEILKENKSRARKTVILTRWHNVWDCRPFDFDPNEAYAMREVINV